MIGCYTALFFKTPQGKELTVRGYIVGSNVQKMMDAIALWEEWRKQHTAGRFLLHLFYNVLFPNEAAVEAWIKQLPRAENIRDHFPIYDNPTATDGLDALDQQMERFLLDGL